MMNKIHSWNDAHEMSRKNPIMHENFKSAGGWDDDIDQVWWVPNHQIDVFKATDDFKLNRHGNPVEFPSGVGSFFVDFHS
jgi:hypothetical protein